MTLAPGATLGVLGGGQLGRMFGIAARRMGYRLVVLDPGTAPPAGAVADEVVCAPFDDLEAVRSFASRVDAVTAEFENVPSEAVDEAAKRVPTRPAGDALGIAQNRLREKRALEALGLPVAPFAAVESDDDLKRVVANDFCGVEAGILKTAGFGYDGKGQQRVRGSAELEVAWQKLAQQPCVLEGLVSFELELSVLGVRGPDGEVVTYAPILNHHVNHILDVSVAPVDFPSGVAERAQELARAVLEGLDYVGVLCVELFLLASGEVVINEIAPRPHNSGHLTIDGHACSQFEQQVRALCALPLGSVEARVPAVAMANLLGDLWQAGEPRWDRALAIPGVRLHLYGKAEARPGRKMGHLTATGATPEEAERTARFARSLLTGGHERPEAASEAPELRPSSAHPSGGA